MKWKVCGMRESNNVAEVAALQPDYMGFILWEGSKRYCPTLPEVPDTITKVGVFVDAPLEEIEDAISTFNLGAVQLHGNELPSLCRALQGKAQVIKAFGFGEDFDFAILTDYLTFCDFFLFEPKDRFQVETVLVLTGHYCEIILLIYLFLSAVELE